MRIIVDTNCIVAAIIRDGLARSILNEARLVFLTIDLSRHELDKHLDELTTKSGLKREEVLGVMDTLYQKMIILPDSMIREKMQQAIRIMDKIDPDDTPFIAAALACNCAIWSDDKHFKKQRKIRIINTLELRQMVKKS